jgi:glycosyltransferase involved in cell wall biosynthesis
MVSVLIPARNERYLGQTVRNVLSHATGNIEVVAVCDGYRAEGLPDDPRVRVLYHERPQGMRASINHAAAVSKGNFLLKLDAHCAMAPGFDMMLAEDCDEDWVVTPKRFNLDLDAWQGVGTAIESHYLTYPWANNNPRHQALRGREWRERAEQRRDVLIDDDMSFQGSCWFMTRKHWNRLGGLSMFGYGPFVQEAQEIGLKTWLGGGAVKINKRTYYCHWRKHDGQGYVLSSRQSRDGILYSIDFWMNNRWPLRVHNLEWLIESFAPVPGWPPASEWRRAA